MHNLGCMKVEACLVWRQACRWKAPASTGRLPATQNFPRPLRPPTGRWQIYGLLPVATLCRCGISRESFGGARGGAVTTKGAEELSGNGGTSGVMQDVCGGERERVKGRLSSCFPSNKSPGALYGRCGRWCSFSSFDHSWNTSPLDILVVRLKPEHLSPWLWALWELTHLFSVAHKHVWGSKYLYFPFQLKC